MLVRVASLPPSLIPSLQNIGILHHKKAKLPKDLQQSVYLHSALNLSVKVFVEKCNRFFYIFFSSK